MNSSKLYAVALAVFLPLAGCGPTVKNVAPAGQPIPARLAFMPVKAPAEMRTERVSYVRDALRRELANAGLLLLNDDVIAKTCKSTDCPERAEVAARHGADGFFELTIESASKNNALLGYVDQIHGTARILDRSGKELVSIENRETETGGLLFNSGQVLEGLKSSVKNYGDNGFNFLADKFAKTICLKIPQTNSGGNQPASAAEERISDVTVQTVRPDTYKICLTGTPGGTASINSGRRRFPLREASNGVYCGTHWLDSSSFGGGAEQPAFFGELRSSFGDVARRDVNIPLAPQCKWDDLFTLMQSNAGNEIKYAAASCPVERFEVYRAPRAIGPYQKVAEVRRSNWIDRPAKSADAKNGGEQGGGVQYQLVAIGRDGSRSKPLTPKLASAE